MKRRSIGCAMLLLPALVLAQSVWRCGPDGRSYADTPCEGGHQVDVADRRSEDRIVEAREQADRQQQLARELAAQRREREAEGRRNGAAALTVSDAISLRSPTSRSQRGDKPSTRRPGAGAGTSRRAGRASPRAAG